MSKFRTALGVALSIAWIVVAYFIYDGSGRPEKGNEWGDYFAGMCSPLAFLWLVLGYWQQGDELKHSTEALRLQAEELKASVEQQSQLVKIERDLFAHELEKSQAREREAIFADTPRPTIESIGMTTGGSRPPIFHVNMRNFGGAMGAISIVPEANETWKGRDFSVWDKKDPLQLDVHMPGVSLHIYMKASTNMGRDVFFGAEVFLDAAKRTGWRGWKEISADDFLRGIAPR
ncbi:hypothetical protein [Mitsuaria sp. GD03876]|uniref:hypothetical protein n=1 Tax=Mitsuaria sp. GD03876 TaxID=2975399 RepID=UPI00244C8775|nr:hypothetical protein [Mitsuaria sp. GD03876]MDH0863233.1 hypothetical protein [Mitsuaria sp. GD03876]